MQMLLLPLPNRGGNNNDKKRTLDDDGDGDDDKKGSKLSKSQKQRLKKQAKAEVLKNLASSGQLVAAPVKAAQGAGRYQVGGSSGSGGRNGGAARVRMPRELIGCDAKLSDGRFLCFNYNLPAGCTGAKPGERCGRGFHLCCHPGCEGAHSYQKCPLKK